MRGYCLIYNKNASRRSQAGNQIGSQSGAGHDAMVKGAI